ncbi:hypothetical protein PPYR_07842 [Photinus pyralis]|uniref:F-box domain-containing protein n=1 Tax=Photinus pyralis TaxID=7054 RepID=A0A1Y1LTB5_PHOPY|nr:uncharacterized protein LOC116168432 [Photinus pyralis]KAB0799962.1 hypothetical protein PPYR_07842 [Photinus pyralis]
MTLLPLELIERILYFSDGQTLRAAKSIDPAWGDIVNFLTEKTSIWKWCCHEEIPQSELENYLDKYENYIDDSKWFNIYDNWSSWRNIKDNVHFDTVLCPVDVPRITYVAVSGTFIAVGSEDGRVKIFEETWGLLHTARYQAVKITDITFMYDDESGPVEADRIFLLLAYKTGTLILTEFDGKLNELAVIQDVKLHSIYQKYLCYERRGGRITISKLCREANGSRIFCEITFLRIYSPNEVSCLHMWSGFATFLINNEVKVLKFDQSIPPVSSVENKVHIAFCNKNQSRLARSCHIYRNNIIICASTDDGLREQFLEVFILGEKHQYSKKLFNSWTALQANITCMFLYGNIFVVGVDVGNVYFYHVTSWKTFDIRNYEKKVIIGRHPIIGIDVKETKQERRFFVTSSFNIHQVIGFTVLAT